MSTTTTGSSSMSMEPFRTRVLKLRENARLGRLHSIAFEFARGRGFPNPLPNPVALRGIAGQQFMKGLDALEYDTLDELLSRPSHYLVGFHGTGSVDAIPSIFSENFDPSRRSGQVFGPGEYFDIEKGNIATQFSRGMDCLIVALIVIKDKAGEELPEVRTPCYHSTTEKIAVVGNPVSKAYALNLPLAVASVNEVSEKVTKRLAEVFVEEYKAMDREDILSSEKKKPMTSMVKKVHYLFTPHVGNYSLRIRAGPSFQDNVVGFIPAGTVVDTFGEHNEWVQVHLGGVAGWSTTIYQGATVLKKVETYRFTPHGGGSYSLRIRAGPSFDDEVKGQIPPGSTVFALGGQSGIWLEISFGGIQGWSAKSLEGATTLAQC